MAIVNAQNSETANGNGLDAFFPKTTPGAGVVQRELECLQGLTRNGIYGGRYGVLTSKKASEMIKLLAPILEERFKKFGITQKERPFFYAQMIAESGAMTMLSETKKPTALGNDSINQLLTAVEGDSDFRPRLGAKTSANWGEHRGKGLMQISRCDNLISVVHYLDQLYSGLDPKWRSYWLIDLCKEEKRRGLPQSSECRKAMGDKAKNGKYQIAEVCKDIHISTFQREYDGRDLGRVSGRKNSGDGEIGPGYNTHLYDILKKPYRLGMVGGHFKDPKSKQEISSEQLMVDASLAYWRGKCGKVAADLGVEKIGNSRWCKEFAEQADGEIKNDPRLSSRRDLLHATLCISKCVHGSLSDWQRRFELTSRATVCVGR